MSDLLEKNKWLGNIKPGSTVFVVHQRRQGATHIGRETEGEPMTDRRPFIAAVLAFLGWRPETPEQKLERLRAKIREAVKATEFKPPLPPMIDRVRPGITSHELP